MANLVAEAYTVAQAARLIDPPVAPITIYRRIYSGELKVLEGSGRLRIPRSELEKFFGRVTVYKKRKRSVIKQVVTV
jgi:Helix-turn-helix domain